MRIRYQWTLYALRIGCVVQTGCICDPKRQPQGPSIVTCTDRQNGTYCNVVGKQYLFIYFYIMLLGV